MVLLVKFGSGTLDVYVIQHLSVYLLLLLMNLSRTKPEISI